MENKLLKDLYDCFYTPPTLSAERREVEECHQALIKALEKPERRLVLRIIDAKDHIIADTSIDSFISGFRLAWRLSAELNNYENERLASPRVGELDARFDSEKEEKDFDIVLSHTCPFKYEPTEMFLRGIDQSTVDDSTERWLDKIEDTIEYKAWFCGHWHTDKRIDKMHFLFKTFESDEQFRPKKK